MLSFKIDLGCQTRNRMFLWLPPALQFQWLAFRFSPPSLTDQKRAEVAVAKRDEIASVTEDKPSSLLARCRIRSIAMRRHRTSHRFWS